jgi:hypothetical protein
VFLRASIDRAPIRRLVGHADVDVGFDAAWHGYSPGGIYDRLCFCGERTRQTNEDNFPFFCTYVPVSHTSWRYDLGPPNQ